MNKILSIIIPSYNMENYIGKCLDSLLISSLNRVEVLIINDGSKDHTLEIARTYEKNYPSSIHVIDKPNGNYGSCINRGLSEATGKYIKVLDADDTFDSANFELFVNFLNTCDADMILSDYVKVDENDNSTEPITLPINISQTQQVNITQLLDGLHREFQMHYITYRRKLLEDINYIQTEGISFTDQEWLYLPTAQVNSVAYFHKVVYRYLIGRAGQTISEEFIKRQVPLIKIAKREIIQYQHSVEENLETSNYLSARLKFNLDYLFRISILYSHDKRLQNNLKELYEYSIIHSPATTKIIDSLRVTESLPFYYSKNWRNNNYTLSIPLRIMRFLLTLRIILKK